MQKYEKVSDWCGIEVSNKEAFLKFCDEITNAKEIGALSEKSLPLRICKISKQMDDYGFCVKHYEDLKLITKTMSNYVRRWIPRDTRFIDFMTNAYLIYFLNQDGVSQIDITDKIDIDMCLCGFTPKAYLKSSVNGLTGYIYCPKCLLQASTIINNRHNYNSIEKNLSKLKVYWKYELAKNEPMKYRIMKEMLKYDANCLVIRDKKDCHDKLWEYARASGLHDKYVGKTRDPEDRSICYNCCELAKELLQIEETKGILDDYLWETLPSKV